VVDRFLESGYEVHVLDNMVTGNPANVSTAAALHVIDIRSAEASALVREGRFSVVAHLAARVDVRSSVVDPIEDAMANVLGSLNLLEAIRTLPARQRPRFVFASTAGVYGDDAHQPTPEETPPQPDSPYCAGKLATEFYLGYYGRIWGIEHVVLRFSNVYGPRQAADGEAGVVAIFMSRLLAGMPLTVYGDGNQTRDYIFVRDVAEAFVQACSAAIPAAGPIESRAFNIGTGLQTSVLELIRTLASISGLEPVINHGPLRPGELERSALDPSKAKQLLKWRARTTIQEGLKQTDAWMTART
jgi:UDP-glucose 4-epimerase